MVHFVGAGPGAEDLITVRGLRYLKEADVVIYAGSLVNPKLLSYTRPGCLIYDSAVLSLPQILKTMEEAHGKGLDIVRLHTGDPSLYGAVAEQTAELAKRGIPYEICPGVSSFNAAAAALGIEYTAPGISQSVVITRAGGRCGMPPSESIASFARHEATMALFLSAGLAEEVKRQLLEGGLAGDTPAAVVYKASWEEQRVYKTTVEELPRTVSLSGITGTALIIVGKVLEETGAASRLYDPSFTTGCRRGGKQNGRGMLYCVGTGPGDAGLLTQRARDIIRSCRVLVSPAARREQSPAARAVLKAVPAAAYLEWLELDLPMSKDRTALENAWEEAAYRIAACLEEGKDTAFLCLGDPSVYASCMYVEERLRKKGYETKMINGIPSFAAAAASCGISLASGSGQLHLIPASCRIGDALKLPGTKVFMKAGKSFKKLRDALLERPDLRLWYVENCGLEEERIVREAALLPEEAGYYSLVIVKEGGRPESGAGYGHEG